MNKPIRIQRKRIKGWRMPKDAIYVGRPTGFGNPYSVTEGLTVEEAVTKYEKMCQENLPFRMRIKEELKGKNLACFCSLDKACHADVLLKIANEDNQ
jgi:hypothetical protein